MPLSADIEQKLNEIQAQKEQRQLPEGVHTWFAHCAIVALRDGVSLAEIEMSFYAFQDQSADEVKITFDWLRSQLPQEVWGEGAASPQQPTSE